MSFQGTLKAGDKVPMSIVGKFISVRRASGTVMISAPSVGLSETPFKQTDSANLADLRAMPDVVFLHNQTNNQIDLEIITSELRISNSDGSVTIAGGSIDRIEESIQVDASATVENGTVHIIAAANLSTKPDMTLAPNTKVKLVDSNANRKALLIQVISESVTKLRIGDSNAAVNRGAIVAGSVSSPASMPVETSGEVWAFNDSDSTATVSLLEVLK